MNNNQGVPSECHQSSKCDSIRGGGGLASEEKVIFVLELRTNPSSSFPQIPQKDYLRG